MKPSFLQAVMDQQKKSSSNIVGQSFIQQLNRPGLPTKNQVDNMAIAEEGETSVPIDAAKLRRNDSVMFMN